MQPSVRAGLKNLIIINRLENPVDLFDFSELFQAAAEASGSKTDHDDGRGERRHGLLMEL